MPDFHLKCTKFNFAHSAPLTPRFGEKERRKEGKGSEGGRGNGEGGGRRGRDKGREERERWVGVRGRRICSIKLRG